ncbi:MAG: hypothetical protein AAB539_00865, partial [Patescibacteria group bacterium]
MPPKFLPGSEKFLSLFDAARQRGVSRDYLRFLIFKKQLHGIKLGRNWVTTDAWLDEYFLSHNTRNARERHIQVQPIISNVAASPISAVAPQSKSDSDVNPSSKDKIEAARVPNITLAAEQLEITQTAPPTSSSSRKYWREHFALARTPIIPVFLAIAIVLFLFSVSVLANPKHSLRQIATLFGRITPNQYNAIGNEAGLLSGFFSRPSERIVENIGAKNIVNALGDVFCNVFFGDCDPDSNIWVVRRRYGGPVTQKIIVPPPPAPFQQVKERVVTNEVRQVTEITQVKEVIDRKEVLVPADAGNIRLSILDDARHTVQAMLTALEQNINDVRRLLSNITLETGANRGMIQLTQRIDQIDSIDIYNGARVRSGDITIDDGSLYITSGGITVANATVENNLTVRGDTVLGNSAGDVLTLNVGRIDHGNSSTTTVPNNVVNVWSIATSSTGVVPLFTIDTTNGGRVGIGTTSPGGTLGVAGHFVLSGSATSTAANGFNISSGCFAVNGTCVSGGSGSPGGATTQIQYNDGGSFGGASNFVYINSTQRIGLGTTTPGSLFSMAAGNMLLSGVNIIYASSSTSTIPAAANALSFATSLTGAPIFSIDASSTVSGRVSVGTSSPYAPFSVWDDLALTGKAIVNIANRASTSVFTISDIGSTTFAGILNVASTTATSTFGNGIRITSGCFELPSGSCAGTGGGIPGGSDSQIQYNNGGSFAGAANFTFDDTNNRLGISTSTPGAL